MWGLLAPGWQRGVEKADCEVRSERLTPSSTGPLLLVSTVSARSGVLRSQRLQYFGAFCLDVRTLTFCQLMGFPLNH